MVKKKNMDILPKGSDIDFGFGLEYAGSGSAVFRSVNVYKHFSVNC